MRIKTGRFGLGNAIGQEADPQTARQSKSGSISTFFLLFAVILVGAISYSVYIGRSVKQKIDSENAADLTAYSTAAHAANGLNMIATNNLAIGASLHIAAASPILARYKAIVQAAMTNIENSDDLLEINTNPDGSAYASWYQYTQHIGALYMKTAAGLTSINVKVRDYWPMGAVAKSLEQMRANLPGAIGLPMRTLRPVGSTVNPLEFFHYDYPHMELTSTKRAMCQSIKASESIGDRRNHAVFWLRAPFGASHIGSGLIDGIETIESVARTIGSTIKFLLEPVNVVTDALYHSTGCSVIPTKWLPQCKLIRKFRRALKFTVPVPEFEGCGQNYEGDFGEMAEEFIKKTDAPNDDIGFLFIHIRDQTGKEEFEKGVEFAVLMGQPQWLSRELPQRTLAGGGSVGSCPEEWRYTDNGRQYCSIIMGGADSMTMRGYKQDDRFAAATGGLGEAFVAEEGGLINPGGLASVWNRVQWSAGQARAVYRSDSRQNDPDAADITSLNPATQMPTIINRMRMQTFWPAWKAELTTFTISGSILRHLKG